MCKLRMSSTLTRCLTRCMSELTPSRLTRVVKKTIARAYYKEINLTRLIRSPICVIILRQMLQAKHEHMTEREKKKQFKLFSFTVTFGKMRPIFRLKLAFRIIMFIACQNSTHSDQQNVSFEKKGHLILHTLITITTLIRLPENALTRLCADQTANIH